MIRRLDPGDMTALYHLWIEGLAECPNAFLASAEEARKEPVTRFEDGLKVGQYWGAFDGGTLVGYAALRGFALVRQSHAAEFGPFYVSKSHAGRGLGRAILAAVIDDARAKGFLQIELSAWVGNHIAIKLYEDFGFKSFGRRPRSVIIDGAPCDDLLMMLMLDQPT